MGKSCELVLREASTAHFKGKNLFLSKIFPVVLDLKLTVALANRMLWTSAGYVNVTLHADTRTFVMSKLLILKAYFCLHIKSRFPFAQSARPKRTGSGQFIWKGPRRARTFFPPQLSEFPRFIRPERKNSGQNQF